uniref:ESPR-type extended signal peptide-containing protein n=1 Tax=Haemophilus haemolyticus TaxID=726 RepID=UPI000E57FF06
MNRIFKVIWNKTTQRTEVVSELARGMAKSSSNSVVNTIKLVKPVLKLSLLSICLGYPTWVMAATNTDDGLFRLQGNELHADLGRGKYIVGVYDRETGSYGFGKAQVGKKDEIWENGKLKKPKAVGNYQLAIGHDIIIASGYKGIAIGSNYDSSDRGSYFSPLDGRQGGTQGAYAVSLGSGAQAIGRHTLALGANSGNGGAYNGYDDAVFLGSLSRIKSVGQGRENDNINVNDLETKYTEAVKAYNDNQTQANLNKVIEAGRNINNAALNKVEGMTIKSNVANPDQAGKFTTHTGQVSQINGSSGTTTVSILSVGGKDDKNNEMYRQIQNVAAGRMSADSFDAVNGSQLYYVRNYTGWNIGHNSNNQDTVTGRVNNDHTVIFKANDNYVNVSTTLDSTNKSTVNIGVNTSDISVTKNNERITAVAANNPTNTVATATSVKTALETFNEVKADKVDIMGYSHVNSNGNTRDEALLKADGTKATFNYEGRNNSSITNASAGATKNNNGKYAEASGAQADRSIATGVYANAFAKDSIAIGTGANVNNYWGSQFSESINGIAIGKLAQVEGSAGAIAFGAGSTILRNESYNVGSANAIAIGNDSKITAASGAIAIGNKATITAIDTGVGNGAVNAIAIGNGATVERRNSIALGQGTKASGVSSIALGDRTQVNGENTVAIGTNVTAAKENSVVIGQNASATKERVVAIGAYAKADGDRTVAIGPEAIASASKSIVIGGLGDNATDNKAQSDKGADQAIVIGNGAQAKAAASYSITLGNSAKTEAVTGISIGDRANVASGANSGIALGKSAVANKSGDIAIGESSSTSDKHTVSGLQIGNATLSTGVAATDNGTVSFGNDNIKRQIQNVGAGEISDKSSDVVTGSQLYYVIKAADEIAKTEYKFKVNGKDIKTMSNKGTSAVNNANNTLDFKAGDGLEVAYENNAVTYKLNADSKQAITDAKNAATTVTNKLNEINQSVARAETAAGKAEVAKTAAETAKTGAEAAKTAAETAKAGAESAKNAAVTAQGKAEAAKTAAETAKTGAEAAKSAAVTAQGKAEAAAVKAKESETNAKASETAAKESETKAKESETNAKASETAAKESETKAKESETKAKESETKAKESETKAKESETKAKESETKAKESETNAKASETAAKESETKAKESETNAKASETA